MTNKNKDSFSAKAIQIIKKIPKGKVSTYGQIAAYAGNPRAARQITWILNAHWEKENLPWHRIVNRNGKIALKSDQGIELQRSLLKGEGVIFDKNDTIDFNKFLWLPKKI